MTWMFRGEAGAQQSRFRRHRARFLFSHFSNIWSTGTIFTDTSLSGNAAICLSSARTSSGVPCVS